MNDSSARIDLEYWSVFLGFERRSLIGQKDAASGGASGLWTDGRHGGGGSWTRVAQVLVQLSHHVSERQCKHQAANWKDKSKEGMVMDLVELREGSCWRCGSLASQKGQGNKTSKA